MPATGASKVTGIARRYCMAPAAVAVAVLIRLLLREYINPGPAFITFFPMVALTAMVAGAGPGAVATILSAAVVDAWLYPPLGGFSLHNPGEVVALALFTASGVMMSIMAARLRRSRERALVLEHERMEAQALARGQEALRASEEFSRRLIASSHDSIMVLDFDGNLLSMSEGGQRLMEIQEIEAHIHEPWKNLWKQDDHLIADEALSTARRGGVARMQVYGPASVPRPRWWDVQITSISGADGRVDRLLSMARDITASKRAERERDLAIEFLRLVNGNTGTRNLLQAAAKFFQTQSGCDAVGIRLREGENYPYYEARGFPEEFVLAKKSLCVRPSGGETAHGRAEDPVPDCICRNVISGRFDPLNPFFTPRGSFWTRSTTRLRDSAAETAVRKAHGPVRCDAAGYESVALIPLRSGEEQLGLLQLNDRRTGLFSPEIIALWERLAGYLGVALASARAEEGLRKSQALLSEAERLSHTGAWEWDLIAQQWTFSDEWRAIHGCDQPTLTFDELTLIIHPDDRPGVLRALEDVRNGIRAYGIEHRIIRRDNGEIRVVRASGQLGRDAHGTPVKVFGVAQDITESKRSEEALQRSQDLYRAIARSIPDGGVCVVDRDLRFLVADGQLASKLIVAKEKPEGRALEEVLDEQLLGATASHFRRALAGETNSYETELQGRTIWSQYVPLEDARGTVTAAMALSLDITERKRAEEALRDALDMLDRHMSNSPLGVVEWDDEYNVTAWNPAAERIFGWSAADTLGLRIDALSLVYEPDWESVRQVMSDMVSGSRPSHINRNRNVRKDGSIIECEWHNTALYDEDGRLRSVLSLVADVTERNRTQRELAAATRNAEEANAAKDQFLAVLSHELRTPLTPVLAAVTMLLKDPHLSQDARRTLEMICRNVEMEARLIDDLLDVTRVTQGKIEMDRQLVDLSAVIGRAVEVCWPDIEARGLHFGVDLGSGPYWVLGDAGRLQQVFWNLLKNAVKFTPFGGCVGVRCRSDGGDRVAIEVHDTGVGIEPEAIDRIFHAFEQAEKSLARQFGGLGLGLSISRLLVEMHGGRIEAQSAGKGRGTCFTVRLPMAPPPAARPFDSDQALHESPPPEAAARPLRIMLVEDHADTANMICRLLVAEGHEIRIAGDVTVALELLEGNSFDVLVSDLGLPDGSGLDLVRSLRARGSELPAIALSGYGQDQDVRSSLEAGFAAHLTKPIGFQQLMDAITAVTAPGVPTQGTGA